MDATHVDEDLVDILFTEAQIQARLGEMAEQIAADYEGKDLDTDITGRHVLIVDEIVDTGLTLSWLVNSLGSRNAASVEIATLLRKPEALTMPVEPTYVGWDIPNEFVVGYGLDYRERYRNLRDIGTLAPHVYS
jgi:hypoxanthine phosphoribosyltransferase